MTDKRPETETINRLFLELSQFTTAKTAREIELEQHKKIVDDLSEQLAKEDKSIEHLLACALIGKCTTVIGKARHQDLIAAVSEAWKLFAPDGPVTGSPEWQEQWSKTEAALKRVV